MQLKMQLRDYQLRHVALVESGNTIVLLPTGAGKTLVAAEAVNRVCQNNKPALFLVPTCMLVTQQADAVRDWTERNVAEYMGGMALPTAFDVLVSTPKAFQNAQLQHPHLLAWSCFGLVIFDEVHHVLKEHPYRQIASHLRNTQLREQHSVRVLGLTASLTYQVSDAKVKAAVQSICSELEIKHMATATLEELRHAGYHAASAPPEVLPLQLPQDQLPEGLLPVQERQPHLLLPSFLARVKRSQATPFSMRLMACISAMEAAAGIVPASSPVQSLQLREWGKWAKKNAARSPRHFAQLEHWYEALRVLVVSWEEAEDAAVTLLRMFGMDMDTGADVWPAAVRATLASFWAAAPPSYPRFDHLKDVLLYKLDQLPSFRCLLFVQQRVMTHILEHVISSDPELRARLRPACIYATTSPATASLSVTASASKERLAAFAAGAVNLLISTVVRRRGWTCRLPTASSALTPSSTPRRSYRRAVVQALRMKG